jgi:putative membrane protein
VSGPRSANTVVAAGRREPVVLLGIGLVAVVASLWRPASYGGWFLESLAVLVAIPLLVLTHRRFPLTPLAYRLILLHALVILLGAHYTYAEVPLGHWLRDALHLARNPYDRIGHLAQGFIPAVVAREVLLRWVRVPRGGWTVALVLCVCMAISACWELLEWGGGVIGGRSADAFMATQGDPFDTQWDMLCCLIGAVASLRLLSRLHDRQLAELAGPDPAATAR